MMSPDRTTPARSDDDIRGFTAVDSAGGCILDGGHGNDTIRGGAFDDKIYGGAGNDRLIGGAGDDNMKGANGRDILYGQAGNDLLRGSYKRDTLIGGDGDADRALHDLVDAVIGCEQSEVLV